MEACKAENNVPKEPFFFRTWVERYIIRKNGETAVRTIDPGAEPVPEAALDKSILRSFFVPKLCNQCADPPASRSAPWGRRADGGRRCPR